MIWGLDRLSDLGHLIRVLLNDIYTWLFDWFSGLLLFFLQISTRISSVIIILSRNFYDGQRRLMRGLVLAFASCTRVHPAILMVRLLWCRVAYLVFTVLWSRGLIIIDFEL